MSNLREAIKNHKGIFSDPDMDDGRKSKVMEAVLNDLYFNGQFLDKDVEDITPSIESMRDGESKFAIVSGDTRRYYRVGAKLFYQTLTEV